MRRLNNETANSIKSPISCAGIAPMHFPAVVVITKFDFAKKEAKCYHCLTMPTLVIKSFPENLHLRLKEVAASHRRSVTQETIYLIEKALLDEENAATQHTSASSKWANRKLLPEYAALEQRGAFRGGTDSTIALSEERDDR